MQLRCRPGAVRACPRCAAPAACRASYAGRNALRFFDPDMQATLAARVLEVEHRIYPLALKLVAEGRVQVVDGRCLIDGVPVPDSASVVPGK